MEIIKTARELFEDLSFTYASKWKQENKSRKIIGFLPIYIPREIVHAAEMLPVGIFGAGDRIPVIRGDAYFQSYICHLPRTVVELALNGNLDDFDGFIFPSICDVIRNLSGIFQIKIKDKFVRYLDFPQNFEKSIGGTYYRSELERLIDDFEKMNNVKITPEKLNASIVLYNENRKLLQELDFIRINSPYKIPAVDFYLVQRAGNVMSVEDHNDYLKKLLPLLQESTNEQEDKIRVVVSGSFCEQPPIGLIKTIENAGCYIVEDDFQLGHRWFSKDIDCASSDPVDVLIDSYLNDSTYSSAVYEGDTPKGDLLAARVKELNADGVIFCAPSFCDPALLDRPMLEKAMDRHHIKHSNFQYHENLGQFHVIKEQAGTFADMIKLWE
ncbi:MAG TPA: benzoyl-CoA reductase subunit C [candidate division Zixibacteria bacterium]|nr:benzoyl-CoA reductase subunit C [candidate division Zixibacteria bacterium]